MRHLDLSNNYFETESSLKIAEALKKNKSIYGFHYSGNAGYVDSRGFLMVDPSNSDDLTGIHVKKRINGKLSNDLLFKFIILTGCKPLSTLNIRNPRDQDL